MIKLTMVLTMVLAMALASGQVLAESDISAKCKSAARKEAIALFKAEYPASKTSNLKIEIHIEDDDYLVSITDSVTDDSAEFSVVTKEEDGICTAEAEMIQE